MPTEYTDDYLKGLCEFPTGAKRIPAGRIAEIGSPVVWIDGNGQHMSTEEYKMNYYVDPAQVWKVKKAYLRKFSGGVRVGNRGDE
jgi:hypothetical protein